MIPNEADLPRWRKQLEQISPRGQDQLSSLYLRWEQGDDWEPIERWIVWHLLPINRTDPAIMAELKGPHPRSTGNYDKDREMWVDGPCRLIDRATWEVFQETGRYGRRWWVIQGTKGGHRHRLSEAERTVWKTLTGTNDTPAPGDLPYAPFDNRVLDQLRGLDTLTRYLAVMSYGMKNVHQLEVDEREEVGMAKRAVADWLARQMEEIGDEYGTLIRRATADFPVANPVSPDEEDRVRADYHLN